MRRGAHPCPHHARPRRRRVHPCPHHARARGRRVRRCPSRGGRPAPGRARTTGPGADRPTRASAHIQCDQRTRGAPTATHARGRP
eukprot:2710331-Prymnesium_polylepis.1